MNLIPSTVKVIKPHEKDTMKTLNTLSHRGSAQQTAQPALVVCAPRRKDMLLQFEGVTLVAALLHQIRWGFAERCNNVATPLVYPGEVFCFYWPAVSLTLIADHHTLAPTWDRRRVWAAVMWSWSLNAPITLHYTVFMFSSTAVCCCCVNPLHVWA